MSGQPPCFVLYLSHADVDTDALKRSLTSIQAAELRTTSMTLAQNFHQEGRLAVLREFVVEELELRFNPLPTDLLRAVRAITDEAKPKSLHRRTARCASIDEFAAGL